MKSTATTLSGLRHTFLLVVVLLLPLFGKVVVTATNENFATTTLAPGNGRNVDGSTEQSQSSPSIARCPTACDCYNSGDTVDCSQRGLLQAPGHLPPATRRLYLEDNRIDRLPAEVFSSASQLTQLVLERNRLSEVNSRAFCGLTLLQELTLASNRIRKFIVDKAGAQSSASSGSVCRAAAAAATGLRELDLSLNLLTLVPRDLSLFAPRLEILDLSCNEISAATLDASFSALRSLRQLDLSRNRIHQLSADDFRPLLGVGLDVLNLGECELSRVDDTALDWVVHNLTYLSLAGNPLSAGQLSRLLTRITSPFELVTSYLQQSATNSSRFDSPPSSVPSFGRNTTSGSSNFTATFDDLITNRELVNRTVRQRTEEHKTDDVSGCCVLTRLDVSQMKIDNLTVSMVANFRRLVVFDAGFSGVITVDPEVFDVISHVETLHLEGGRLTQLENLPALKQLRRVYLQENRLEEVVRLDGLYGLVSVDLSYNRIRSVPSYWLNGLRNLQVLNLSHNEISEIESNCFHQVAIFSTLDLSYNRLRSLHGYGLVRLLRLDVSHNSIGSVDTSSFQGLHQTFQELDLSFNNLTNFYAARLFHQTNNLLRLNLGHNPLGPFLRAAAMRRSPMPAPPAADSSRSVSPSGFQLDEDAGDMMTSSSTSDGDDTSSLDWAWPDDTNNPLAHLTSLAVLDLGSCDVTHLGCDVIASMRGLVDLVLSDNSIAKLDDVSVGCGGVRLARLVVSGNRLTDLDPDCISGLSGLTELDASDNPLLCAASDDLDSNGDPCTDPFTARSAFIRWLNTTTGRKLTVVGRDTGGYRCHDDVRKSYIQDSNAHDCVSTSSKFSNSAAATDNDDDASLTSSQLASERRRRTVVFVTATVLSTTVTLLILLPVVFCIVIRCGFARSAVDGYQLQQETDTGSHRSSLSVVKVALCSRFVKWIGGCRRPRSTVRYREVSREFDVTTTESSIDIVKGRGH